MKYNKGNQTENPFLATQFCNSYGLCTKEIAFLIAWLDKSFSQGMLREDETGLPLSKIGSLEFIEALTDITAKRKGFGDLLSQGLRRASIEKGKEAEKIALSFITETGYNNNSYGGRVFYINSLFYATERKDPIILLHEVNFVLLKWSLWHITKGAMSPITTEDVRKIAARVWGGEKAADFSTYEGKGKAAVLIQNRQHAKEAMVGCDWFYPLIGTDQTQDHIGDPSLLPKLFSAVTGREMSEDDYMKLGERSVNLQRAIHGREGKVGRKDDTIGEFNFTEPVESMEGMFGMFNPDFIVPGKGDEVIVKKGTTLSRAGFEQMKDEYYEARGWDVKTGLQTRKGLEALGLGSIANDLGKRGLLKI
jgi:aldehyde:ferredoxin oxidoreductase